MSPDCTRRRSTRVRRALDPRVGPGRGPGYGCHPYSARAARNPPGRARRRRRLRRIDRRYKVREDVPPARHGPAVPGEDVDRSRVKRFRSRGGRRDGATMRHRQPSGPWTGPRAEPRQDLACLPATRSTRWSAPESRTTLEREQLREHQGRVQMRTTQDLGRLVRGERRLFTRA